jgi:hypothetical protein
MGKNTHTWSAPLRRPTVSSAETAKLTTSTYSAAVDEMAALIAVKHDFAARVRRFFIEQPKKLVLVVLKPALAETTTESSIGLEPSELFLELLEAVRANDGDRISVLEHETFS